MNNEQMSVVLGIVAMTPKGEYSSEVYYEKLNTVLYNDSTYMAIKPSTGVLPTDTEYWQLIGGGVTKEYVQGQVVDNLDSNETTKSLSAKQGNNLNKSKVEVFDTVALMKAANLKNGMTAQTLGYYEVNDGGGATYKITNEESETEYQEELDNDLYATLIVNNTINVKQFGAKGDGITDDKTAIQNALDYVKNGGSIYFPKNFPNKYLILSGLTLSKDDVTLYSEPRTEYKTTIYTPENINMLTVTGYGCKINSLVFWGNGSKEEKSTTNGIIFDRSSLGDEETYSNIDAEIKDSAFFYLNDAVTIKGKNLYFHDNVLVICHRGIVGILHKYNNNTQISAFRGIRITNNRFHSMNEYYQYGETILTPDTLDSWCIETPEESDKVHHIEITNNNMDFGYAGFYKGYLCGAVISNNILYSTPSILVKSDGSDASLHGESDSHWGVIENNSVRSFAHTGESSKPLNESFIILNNYNNIMINSNNFRGSSKDAIKLSKQSRCYITNNIIQYFGYDGNTEQTQYSAIKINGDYNKVHIANNFITNTIDYSKGITCVNSGTVYMTNNHFENISTLFDIPATSIKSQDYGLEWIKPTLQNSFEYSTELTSNGYRKLEDGTVEISVYLKNGTDNATAFNLPSGYRPKEQIRIPNIAQWQTSNDSAICQINTDGNVKINFDNGIVDPSTKTFIVNVKFPCQN